MQIIVDAEIKYVCKEILKENKEENQWALIESSDMFQTKHYCGGYDAIENAFCFSYYDEKGKEFFLQITLKKVKEILEGKIKSIEVTR